jgi:hypothetical protein
VVPLAILMVALDGCATGGVLPPLAVGEAQELAVGLERESSLDAPQTIFFSWSLVEPRARLRGAGVARVEPPYRARLDLYLNNGELLAVASLDGDAMQVLNAGRAGLPPAPLLWGALGVFRPGPDAVLQGGGGLGEGPRELTYRVAGADVVYRLRDRRIQSVGVSRGNRLREELRLVHDEGEPFPTQAVYRDLDVVRELTIILDSVEDADPFPAAIWDLRL